MAIKEFDKSAFLYNGTGIPTEIRFFFNSESMAKGERREILLRYKGTIYNANIQMDRYDIPRTRLFWRAELPKVLRTEFAELYEAVMNDSNFSPLLMCFAKSDEHIDQYDIEIRTPLHKEIALRDIESELIENGEIEIRSEGTVKYHYGKRYERDVNNRRRAIDIHGLTCVVCNFNFEKAYGERGKDFIEIHHIKPLSTLEGQTVKITPETDLVPLCANCHRMIHRRHDKVLTIEELKEIVEQMKSTEDQM